MPEIQIPQDLFWKGLAAAVAVVWALMKWFAVQYEKSLREKMEALSNAVATAAAGLTAESNSRRDLERRFMELQAELPKEYVRREDFIQVYGKLEARIENFALRMERALDHRGPIL